MVRQKAEPSIVVIGGGTGLSNMLRGLKLHTGKLTAIVTMADDGGSSGTLRDELGMLPPGDVRNCLQALANTEPTMEQLLGYRFTDGALKGQSMGNLFLAALNDISGSFYEAVCMLSEVLAITGRVLPVTTEDVRLLARFDDGTEVLGESKIREHKKQFDRRITKVSLIPENPPALQESLEAINSAELIVLGPGSLYTSIIPNLLTKGVTEAIESSKALKIYVLNVSTQDGETEMYTASDHVKALFSHSGKKLFDYCLANSTPLPEDVAARYREQGASRTVVDTDELEKLGVTAILKPMLDCTGGLARHNPQRLADEIMDLYREKSPTRIFG
ncbi:MAG: gluconeogenesis factor YvcK family protein [Oscillospiraceae bacterium]|nr:gluconeogenesis factor YvcK family protein [Oscillospiraceae bacterium]